MKNFLGTFGVIAASFAAATTASATPVTSPTASTTEQAIAPAVDGNKFKAANESGDLMNFTLKRAGVNGPMFADHESHASHASHASHRSHFSSY
jgi:hypothetical protein